MSRFPNAREGRTAVRRRYPANSQADSYTVVNPAIRQSGKRQMGGDIAKRRASLELGEALRFHSDRSRHEQGARTWPARSLPAEAVEFSVACTAEKRMPLVRRKSENWAFGIPAVTEADGFSW
jgi:hypothetical protein